MEFPLENGRARIRASRVIKPGAESQIKLEHRQTRPARRHCTKATKGSTCDLVPWVAEKSSGLVSTSAAPSFRGAPFARTRNPKVGFNLWIPGSPPGAASRTRGAAPE